jgi:glucose-1-phosphate thymidylyltransferase
MKGIILAGGFGTRLYPMTSVISKQLLQVYNKPMIYYPLSILMLSKISEILIISDPKNIIAFKELLGEGSLLGLQISYAIQNEPNGIAEAINIGKDFIDNKDFVLILGDNIFIGEDIKLILNKAIHNLHEGYSTLFTFNAANPEKFGVVEVDNSGHPISIIEKPKVPKSNLVITGLYFYKNDVVTLFNNLRKSKRNEFEISDINRIIMERKGLRLINMGNDFIWYDTGTPNSLMDASNTVRTLENSGGFMIGCIEEIAYKNKWVDSNTLILKMSDLNSNNEYVKYVLNLIQL